MKYSSFKINKNDNSAGNQPYTGYQLIYLRSNWIEEGT